MMQMPLLHLILLLLALIFFLASTIGVQWPGSRPLNLQALGLALITLFILVR